MLNQNNAYRMLCWTVVSVLMLWSAGDAGALRIRNTATGETFQIGDQGTITTDMSAQPDQGTPLDPATGSLVFTKGEDATVAMGDGEVRVAGPLHAPGITQVATEDMTIENPNLAGDQPQAVLKKEGAFVATGGISDNGIPVAAVAYFDDMAVFESDASADMQLAYANLDGEGRVEFGETTDAVHFYIRDHLGSTRMVITDDGQGNPQIVESNAYLAYGTKRTLSGGGAVELRDEFTGKEYDEEGAVDGVTEGVQAYYFGARMYDPITGLWFSTDPSDQFFNAYAYPADPLSYIDPNGEDAGLITGFLLEVAIGVATSIATYSLQAAFMQMSWEEYVEGLDEALITGAVYGAGRFGTNVLLSNVIPTPRFRTATMAWIWQGALQVGLNTAFAYGAERAMGTEEEDALLKAAGAAVGTGTEVLLGGARYNPWSLARPENRIRAMKDLTAGKRYSGEGRFPAIPRLRYTSAKVGGILTRQAWNFAPNQAGEARGGSGMPPRTRTVRDFAKTALHELYHTYTGYQVDEARGGIVGSDKYLISPDEFANRALERR